MTAPTNWQWFYKSADSDLRADVSYVQQSHTSLRCIEPHVTDTTFGQVCPKQATQRPRRPLMRCEHRSPFVTHYRPQTNVLAQHDLALPAWRVRTHEKITTSLILISLPVGGFSVGGIGNVVAQNLRVGGHTWTLKHGPNSNWDVFSFITAEGDITDFRADLADFFRASASTATI